MFYNEKYLFFNVLIFLKIARDVIRFGYHLKSHLFSMTIKIGMPEFIIKSLQNVSQIFVKYLAKAKQCERLGERAKM